jgi:hypothetical protein
MVAIPLAEEIEVIVVVLEVQFFFQWVDLEEGLEVEAPVEEDLVVLEEVVLGEEEQAEGGKYKNAETKLTIN